MKRLLYILTTAIVLLIGCSDSGIEGVEDKFDKTLLNGKDISGMWVPVNEIAVKNDYYVIHRLLIIDGETIKVYSKPISVDGFLFKEGYLYECSLDAFQYTESATFNLLDNRVYINGKYINIDLEFLDNNTLFFAWLKYINIDLEFLDNNTLFFAGLYKKVKGFCTTDKSH